MIKYWKWALIISASALTACSSSTVKDTLGLERSAPDEFRVVSRPPLSVPPEFTLRPPTNANAPLNQASASDQAKSLLVGGQAAGATPADTSVAKSPVAATSTAVAKAAVVSVPKENSAKASSAEAQFLKDAGADRADPKVRDVIVEEQFAKQEQVEECSWWQLMCKSPEKKDPVVDAKKESDRIKNDADAGKPVSGDDAQVTKTRDTGVLGSIFGY